MCFTEQDTVVFFRDDAILVQIRVGQCSVDVSSIQVSAGRRLRY